MKTLRFGFDYDGVIDRYPESVRWLSNLLLHSGHEVYVITGRRDGVDWEQTVQSLKRLKIRYTGLYLYPGGYEFDGRPLTREVTQGIGEWKSGLCDELGIDIFFDDGLHGYQTDFSCGTVHV